MAQTDRLLIALAQLDPTVGDVDGNLGKARAARAQAALLGADVVMFPELFLAGYPPEDLVLKPAFQQACRAACDALARETVDGGPTVLIGLPWFEDGVLTNAFVHLAGGRIDALRHKVDLPNYGVFDEKRVFAAGPMPGPIVIKGVRIGLPICEDIWTPDVVECLAETGSEIILVPNGSPYHRGKPEVRLNLMLNRVVETGLPLVYLNMIGGQDDQVFDGASFVLNPGGALACQLPQFEAAVAVAQAEAEAAEPAAGEAS
jgi:NAD+ synthase